MLHLAAAFAAGVGVPGARHPGAEGAGLEAGAGGDCGAHVVDYDTTYTTLSRYPLRYYAVRLTTPVGQKKTLASEIVRLRKEYGSHDKLADELGTYRQTVIDWEGGAMPQKRYRDKLVSLGIDPALFIPPDTRRRLATAERHLRDAQRELRELRERLGPNPGP